ncbi:Multicopper oxidase with three cupredoxin domains (includes cell division protein FtsP and spore coat protein CotA) [Enhydrobacter aerosaccus]|uniref:Multicopper oxidase with three cupredoxin domains (Includes cell division protein FtsP and spore coat protein CotA) n=2 Tax=Enhydrobacter aerosaccus TaxID=225324 RepID=A0A1T4SKA9_9HYPH|nr:Multicopper oxidase with three cupredoxin domains (includes cell division protein FtsP and spore coat protein CotA) [Enhydrobacter aerosaccus]
MGADHIGLLTRRAMLSASAGAALLGFVRPSLSQASQSHRIAVARGQAPLTGPRRPATDVWAYDGVVPGPTLRVRQGEPVSIVVDNGLEEDTTVHWHGIRLPIGMDGVPGISQAPIRPGEKFVYEFTPPDAGTFWYHPHANTLEQLGRGLAGALIVEERSPVPVDRELVWTIMDWRLRPDGQIARGFGNMMEAAMSGRIGNTVTINGVVPTVEPVRAGERVRIRLINAALARIMALRFEGHHPVVVAIDGQPCDPHVPKHGRLLLGPAMRIDIVLDMQGEPSRRYEVIDDFDEELKYSLVELAYDAAPPMRMHPSEAPLRLPRNPLPTPDLKAAELRELVLQGGMMGMRGMGGMARMGRAAWAINSTSMTGDGHAGMPPLATLELGRSYVLRLRNDTAWWHPMHLHGHSFRVLSRNGAPVPHNQWADTVLVAPKETVDVAFVADNPGDWMLHCHVTDHQTAGLMATLRIEGAGSETR